jgi:hypothetical protein
LTNLSAGVSPSSFLARTSHRGAITRAHVPLDRFWCEIMHGLMSVLLQWFKRAVKSTLFFLGYQLVPAGAAAENVDFVAAKKVKDSHFYSIRWALSSLQPVPRTSRFHKVLRRRRTLYFTNPVAQMIEVIPADLRSSSRIGADALPSRRGGESVGKFNCFWRRSHPPIS